MREKMEIRNAYQILFGKPEEERQFGRPSIILTWKLKINKS
jgi:hypothetical protein